MTPVLAHTLGRAVSRAGPALHGGQRARATLVPARPGAGLRFVTPAGEIPATLPHAEAEPGATVLRAGGATVRTPEHLLAALAALGVWDCEVRLDGDELPALDGAAAAWVAAIDEAGRAPTREIVPFVLDEEQVVDEGASRAVLGPGDTIGVRVRFDDGPGGELRVPATEAVFRAEIAWARTFVLARDVDRLRAAGRGRGATAENTVVWPDPGLRHPDEPVRHKLLDAWGDLALLGPARVRWEVALGSHAFHLLALRRALRSGGGGPA